MGATPGTGQASAAFWLALAAAGLLAGLTHSGRGARAGRWGALLLLGSAALLQLTAAGPLIRYQHFLPLSLGRGGTGTWAALILLGQLTVVAIALRGHAADLLTAFRNRWPGVRGLALAAVFAGTSATLSASVPVYAQELALATLGQALQLATLALGLRAMPAEWHAQLAAWCAPAGSAGRDRAPLLLAAAATVVAALLSLLAYQRHPHIPDEVVYLLHARTLASGALWLPVPPVLSAFDLDITLTDPGRWYSAFPPGWPLVLAVGAAVGAEWLVNPVLAGVNVLLAYGVTWRLYDRGTARLVAVLLAASPWHLFLGMSFMSQTVTLTTALLAALGVVRWRRGDGAGWLVLAGLAAGWTGLTRPLDGVMVVTATGLWLVWPGSQAARLAARAGGALAYGVGLGLSGLLTLWYNRALTGHPLSFPVMVWSDRVFGPGTNALGFGPTRGFGWTSLDPFPGHGWRDVLVNTNLNAFQVNTELHGWATGSLLLVAALLLRRWPERRDLGLLLATLLVVGVQALYWFSGGPDFGARYWFLALFPIVLLSARGALSLGTDAAPGRGLTAAVALTAVALVVFVPWRAMDKYHHYRRMRPDLRALADSAGFGRSLVLVQGSRFPDYAGAAPFNPLDLRAAQPVYALDRDAAVRDSLLAAYPDRPVWIVAGPSVTGGGYRLVAGPFMPGAPVAGPAPGPAP